MRTETLINALSLILSGRTGGQVKVELREEHER